MELFYILFFYLLFKTIGVILSVSVLVLTINSISIFCSDVNVKDKIYIIIFNIFFIFLWLLWYKATPLLFHYFL